MAYCAPGLRLEDISGPITSKYKYCHKCGRVWKHFPGSTCKVCLGQSLTLAEKQQMILEIIDGRRRWMNKTAHHRKERNDNRLEYLQSRALKAVKTESWDRVLGIMLEGEL